MEISLVIRAIFLPQKHIFHVFLWWNLTPRNLRTFKICILWG